MGKYSLQNSKVKGVPKKLVRIFEVWQLLCPKMPRVPKNVKKCPERSKLSKIARKYPELPNLKKFYLELFLYRLINGKIHDAMIVHASKLENTGL